MKQSTLFAAVLSTAVVFVPMAGKAAAPSNAVIPAGYAMTAVATGLNFPSSITFQGDTYWVTEAGIGMPPAVKTIDNKGNVTTALTAAMLPAGALLSPLTDILFERGWLWVVHAQTSASGVKVGAISRFRPADPVHTFQTVVSGLPSFGDHPSSQIVFGPGGRAYFTVATATNSSVVGPDNSWATTFPTLHDFPAVDVALSGFGYQTQLAFPLDPTAVKITEPFMPFGGGMVPAGTKVSAPSPAHPQDGIIAGSGTVYSFNPEAANPASTLRLEGWGFRDPYGLTFDPLHPGMLFVSNNGSDVRTRIVNGKAVIAGSRPVANDWDDMFVIHVDRGPQFFGWPDYFHDPVSRQPLPVTNPMFCPAGANPCAQFAFSDAFRATLNVRPAFAELENHSSSNMFDFSRTGDFGYRGDIFIAETGSFPPGTGATSLTGYKVARIDRSTGNVSDFITHPSDAPAVILVPDGFNKPIDVRFRGSRMFIVDFGVFLPGTAVQAGTGKIWMVTHAESEVETP